MPRRKPRRVPNPPSHCDYVAAHPLTESRLPPPLRRQAAAEKKRGPETDTRGVFCRVAPDVATVATRASALSGREGICKEEKFGRPDCYFHRSEIGRGSAASPVIGFRYEDAERRPPGCCGEGCRFWEREEPSFEDTRRKKERRDGCSRRQGEWLQCAGNPTVCDEDRVRPLRTRLALDLQEMDTAISTRRASSFPSSFLRAS
ncbi:hypothetical protein HPB50_026586 [Hyalomma asiaticum]|uniref:Uncharacterized protein n=1 Tax=Hyalomma asiaticum TaxID=266040 RepID=A0ACB7T2T9_HYAAI|nr:hypothetical protein HPB50_026586 [Hyalomma asiaticum]